MSILDGTGFDQRVASTGSKLRSIVKDRRESGLKSIKEELEKANLEGMNESDLQNFAFSIQQNVVANEELASEVTLTTTEEQVDAFLDSREASKKRYKYEIATSIPEDDPLLQNSSANSAGLFLLERDAALRNRVAAQFSSNPTFTPFENAYGPKAEEQYWNLVSGAWVGRARSGGILSSMRDSGQVWCRVAAEIDERTTSTCRFLHRKRVLVSSLVADTAGLVDPGSTSNWIEETDDPISGGENSLIYLPSSASGVPSTPIARRTEEFAFETGLAFDMGKYDQYMTDAQIAQTIGPPPYHFLCRSVLVPDDFDFPLDLQAETSVAPVPEEVSAALEQTPPPDL